ncbi:MAG: hypothetical protein WBY94_07200 [Polyangiaceae bacterium]
MTAERFRRLSWAWLTYKPRRAIRIRTQDVLAELARRQRLDGGKAGLEAETDARLMNDEERKAPGPPCPVCKETNPRPVMYGMPPPEMGEAAARGEIALGGCVVGRPGGYPQWECRKCGRRYGLKRFRRAPK